MCWIALEKFKECDRTCCKIVNFCRGVWNVKDSGKKQRSVAKCFGGRQKIS